MELLAAGLAGQEAIWYGNVVDNPWLGGNTSYSPPHEDLPYWLNGLTGLAYALDDEVLLEQVTNISTHVLNSQVPGGWFGPAAADRVGVFYARFPAMLALMQLAEANPPVTDQVVSLIYNFIPLLNDLLKQPNNGSDAIYGAHWGKQRYADAVIVLQWLLENHPGNMETEIYQTIQNLYEWGADWQGFYTEDSYIFQDLDTLPYDLNQSIPIWPLVHNVNYAQGLKTMGVIYRWNNNQSLIQTSINAINWTLQYHGSAAGTVIGDERLSGAAPNRGSEFCGVVEELYSLEYLHQLFGIPEYADLIERIAFSAMASQLNEHHYTHQYISIVNQAQAALNPQYKATWWNTHLDANTFGVQPDYPCCTVNHPQGYSKLAQAVFSRSEDGTALVHNLLLPATARTVLGSSNKVSVTAQTTYPFGQTISYTIHATSPFQLLLRVPAWSSSDQSSVSLNGKPTSASTFDSQYRMISVSIPAGTSTASYSVAATLFTEDRANNTVAVYRGSVLYALDVGQAITDMPTDYGGAPNNGDFNSTSYINQISWDIAIDPSTLQFHTGYSGTDPASLPNPLWAHRAPPSYVTARACQIKWGQFGSLPDRPPHVGSRNCTGPVQNVTLRPYGSQRARIAEFPTVSLG